MPRAVRLRYGRCDRAAFEKPPRRQAPYHEGRNHQYSQGRRPPMKDTQKSGKSTTATKKKAEGFTDEERAAIKERVRETKAVADKADGEGAVLASIAAMAKPDRAMAERLD